MKPGDPPAVHGGTAMEMHPATGAGWNEEQAAASLRSNRIDPKFLYVTAHQAELWRRVFLRHSPIHGNPEFARIYREAFARIAAQLPAREILLAGLGSGTGMKERELYAALRAQGRDALFSAIDISPDLVADAAARLADDGARTTGNLVCDLAEADFLARWLDEKGGQRMRLMTFFGIIPNFLPAQAAELFRRIVRPGDLLLASVHLAPIDETHDIAAAMKAVLPQYDNEETRAWLAALPEEWELSSRVDAPKMGIGEIDGAPAFVATARWKSREPFEQWGRRFVPPENEPLRVFSSLRYTPALFEERMRRDGFRAERLALTRCREEGIWAIRR